ncbi:methyltransferase, FkbM family [Methylobacterium sp. 174MFSha1.1]|uniref:FkbM family methyltransferase n=1 Tax=Methylobacterium sp. 174MFSha1.1 TaxID=1502749 RepID=UPI0008E49733|nr:FkbM family methyltransferase [Methylobacterium sp. 174MFSha1.1]SFU66817.1 methyltransferase, FkbM family [Methylobacterium sp. 174MFSha1.1]
MPAQHELIEGDKLKKFFAHFRVDCVFDVGANRGQYRDVLRDVVGFSGPVISFEPIPEAFETIRSRSEQDPDWHVRQVALDRFAGRATFNVMANDKFSSIKAPSASDYSKLSEANTIVRSIDVEATTLADELRSFSERLGFRRPFLKMDTQGHDAAVVEGAGVDILRFVGLQSELSIKKLYADTLYFHEVISYYSAKGFALSSMHENNAGHFPDLVEMDCIMYRKIDYGV